MELIFGREFKLEAADPYLFFAYKFRDLSLETKLIVALGYGFGDGHINKMLTQSLRGDSERRLLVIQRCPGDKLAEKKQQVAKMLELGNSQVDQIVVQSGTAKEFLEMADLARELIAKIPAGTNNPF